MRNYDNPIVMYASLSLSFAAAIFSIAALGLYDSTCGQGEVTSDDDDGSVDVEDLTYGPGFALQAVTFTFMVLVFALHIYLTFSG